MNSHKLDFKQKSFLFISYISSIIIFISLGFPHLVNLGLCLLLLRPTIKGKKEIHLTLISLLFIAIAYNFAAAYILSRASFYRPHEKFAKEEGHYKPLVKDQMRMPYGDLVAIDPKAPIEVRESREVTFITDSLGYRNNEDYENHNYVLIGDSFIVGNGNDQSQIIPNVLKDEFDIDSYSIAYPASPGEYIINARKFLKSNKFEGKFIIFLYEGNDFLQGNSNADSDILLDWTIFNYSFTGIFKSFPAYKLTSGMIRNIRRRYFDDDDSVDSVSYYRIRNKMVGFYNRDNLTTFDKTLRITEDFTSANDILSRTSCLVFIPTKLRVYRQSVSDLLNKKITQPPAVFTELHSLSSEYNMKFIDLTPEMQGRSDELLAEGKYTFWRDDTHWNYEGIKIAAKQIANKCFN